jgi:hypothetical protein
LKRQATNDWDFPAGMLELRALLAAKSCDLGWGHMFDGNLYATFLDGSLRGSNR